MRSTGSRSPKLVAAVIDQISPCLAGKVKAAKGCAASSCTDSGARGVNDGSAFCAWAGIINQKKRAIAVTCRFRIIDQSRRNNSTQKQVKAASEMGVEK